MHTYATLAEARTAAASLDLGYGARILLVDLDNGEQPYIISDVNLTLFKRLLADAEPGFGVRRAIDEYPVAEPVERSEADEALVEIGRLYDRAEARRDCPAEHHALRRRAEQAEAEWVQAHPQAAEAREAARLRSLAEGERRVAREALTYDADGAIDRDGRQARHDEHMAAADSLDARAARLGR